MLVVEILCDFKL